MNYIKNEIIRRQQLCKNELGLLQELAVDLDVK